MVHRCVYAGQYISFNDFFNFVARTVSSRVLSTISALSAWPGALSVVRGKYFLQVVHYPKFLGKWIKGDMVGIQSAFDVVVKSASGGGTDI